jgi:putative PIN family toxin of toxin-antitoxin system
MKAVPDSNVIVSAFASHGLCRDLLELLIGRRSIVLSRYILDESHIVAVRKLRIPEFVMRRNIAFMESLSDLVEPDKIPSGSCRDSADIPVLGTAAASQADYLVTGDEDLLVLKRFGQTRIISPRECLRILLEMQA